MLRDLDNAEARSKIVSSGHELIRERYSRRSSVQQWAKCIEAACNLPVKQCDDMRVEPSARGRLESIMGETLGASLRTLVGRKPKAKGPGAEWPHGYSRTEDKDTFWKAGIRHFQRHTETQGRRSRAEGKGATGQRMVGNGKCARRGSIS